MKPYRATSPSASMAARDKMLGVSLLGLTGTVSLALNIATGVVWANFKTTAQSCCASGAAACAAPRANLVHSLTGAGSSAQLVWAAVGCQVVFMVLMSLSKPMKNMSDGAHKWLFRMVPDLLGALVIPLLGFAIGNAGEPMRDLWDAACDPATTGKSFSYTGSNMATAALVLWAVAALIGHMMNFGEPLRFWGNATVRDTITGLTFACFAAGAVFMTLYAVNDRDYDNATAFCCVNQTVACNTTAAVVKESFADTSTLAHSIGIASTVMLWIGAALFVIIVLTLIVLRHARTIPSPAPKLKLQVVDTHRETIRFMLWLCSNAVCVSLALSSYVTTAGGGKAVQAIWAAAECSADIPSKSVFALLATAFFAAGAFVIHYVFER